jgi:hypothetical protein
MGLRILDTHLSHRHPALRFLIEAAIFLIVLGMVIAGGWWLYYRIVDWPLVQEQQRLLTTHAPEAMFPNGAVKFAADGKVKLPDGRRARLAELDLSLASDQKRIETECASVLLLIKSKKVGYTITGTDPDGTPVVHLWALSVNQFRGLDDEDEYEHQRANWLLWRNVSAVLVAESNFPRNGAAAEKLEAHTPIQR